MNTTIHTTELDTLDGPIKLTLEITYSHYAGSVHQQGDGIERWKNGPDDAEVDVSGVLLAEAVYPNGTLADLRRRAELLREWEASEWHQDRLTQHLQEICE